MSVGGQDFTGDARDHEATPEDEELQFCPRQASQLYRTNIITENMAGLGSYPIFDLYNRRVSNPCDWGQ